MRTGPDQGQIGPLLACKFFWRERFARNLLSSPIPVLSDRISVLLIAKLLSSLFEKLADVLNLRPSEWILRRGSVW